VTPTTSGAAQLPRASDGCRSRVRICVNSQSPSPIVNTRPPPQAFQRRRIQRNADRPTPEQCVPIRAALIGSHRCEAEGISVCAAAPVLALCRKLVSAGHDPRRPLHWRCGCAQSAKECSLRSPAMASASGAEKEWLQPRICNLRTAELEEDPSPVHAWAAQKEKPN